MTKIIVDTNIVFSALLNVNSRIGQILINGKNEYHPAPHKQTAKTALITRPAAHSSSMSIRNNNAPPSAGFYILTHFALCQEKRPEMFGLK